MRRGERTVGAEVDGLGRADDSDVVDMTSELVLIVVILFRSPGRSD